MKPCARRDELVIEELPEETLVYDLKRHKAYCLNRTMALIWRHCDGKTDIRQLSRVMEKGLSLPPDEDLVRFALERLGRAGLLSASLEGRMTGIVSSRRQLLLRWGWIGGVAALLPTVIAITAPTAVSAASCVTPSDCKNFNRANVGKCCCNKRRCVTSGVCGGLAC